MGFKPSTAIFGSILKFFLNQYLVFNILFIIMGLDIVDGTFFKSRCVVNGITERLLLYISIISEFFFRLHLLDKNSVTPIFLFESSFLLIEQLIIPATFLSNANL